MNFHDCDTRPATEAEAHVEWHLNSGVPMGTPGCPQDACHADEADGYVPTIARDRFTVTQEGATQVLTTEASSLMDELYAGALRVPARAGNLIEFTYAGEAHDREGELLYTDYEPTRESGVSACLVRVFND